MSKTKELINSWLAAKNNKDATATAASHANTALTNAVNNLGKRLMEVPKGSGESPKNVCAWVPLDETHEQLIRVSKKKGYGDGDYDINFYGEKREI